MTVVGHVLTGAALGITVLPRRSSLLRAMMHLLTFGLLANVPDLPVGDWGHELYYYSHSVFSNLILIILAALLLTFSPRLSRRIGGWPVVLVGAAAWLSHLLLDSLYGHGLGVGIFWPFSRARLALPIPWFSVMDGGLFPFTPEKARILLIEIACFLPLFILAVLFHRLRVRETDRRLRPPGRAPARSQGAAPRR